jgi:hypothetical protein
MKTYVKTSLIVSLSTAALILAGGLLVSPSNAYGQEASIRSIAAQPAAPTERRVFVRSKALLVRAAVVEEKLMKRPEFNQLGLAITRDESNADIILELRHDVLTKYVYSAVETKTQTVLAGGKVSSLGGTVAGKVAKRFVKQLQRGRP